jgi:hypothetical protein
LKIKRVFLFSLQLLSETFLILRRIQQVTVVNGRRFSKNHQISHFMKIRPVGAELFHVDGQTDVTKVIVAFRSFANTPKNDVCQMSDPY